MLDSPDGAQPSKKYGNAAASDKGPQVGEGAPELSGGELMMHHYHLSTRHVARTPRSDARPETLASLRSTIEVAIGGQAVPLPGFPNYSLSIRNIWIGAVGWLIEGAERRVMVRCVTAWTVEGAAKGLRWLATELPEELGLPCCLVKLGVPLLEDPDAASWLDDTERCISWALLPRPVPKLGPFEIGHKSAT